MNRWSNITSVTDPSSWFEDYVRRVISGAESKHLPPTSIKFGQTTSGWEEISPGVAHISVEGGTLGDRDFAQRYLQEALAAAGIARARYEIEPDHSHRTANWREVEEGAKRLLDSGKVHVNRNGAEVIAGMVEGDHGNYESTIWRNDPNSNSIALWECTCPWDQFSWQRTRQWKRYEGRPCKHVLALYWQSRSLPLDEEYGEGGGEGGGEPAGGAPQGGGGEGAMFPQVPAAGGMVPPGASPALVNPQPGIEGQAPVPQQPPVGQAPQVGEQMSMLPPYPGNPDLLPAVNPVSIPGAKEQSPLNPVQNAGGTFSHVAAGQKYVNGDMVQLKEEEPNGVLVGLNAGGRKPVPPNSIGEVFGTDPITGMVNVYYAGPQAQAGKLEPHGVMCWHWPSEIIPRPDIRKPGPAIRGRS